MSYHRQTGSYAVGIANRLEFAIVFNFGRSKANQNDLTSLNLDVPAVRPEARQEPVTKQENPLPARDPQVSAELGRRALELANSGKHPEAIFWLLDPATRAPVLIDASKKTVLLFSSAATARFFMQERNLQAEIMGVAFDQFPLLSEDLHTLGVNTFVMDLSPKSPVSNVLSPTGERITKEQIAFCWALGRTIRNFQAQRILGPLLASKDFGSPDIQKKLRHGLETVRGSGGYDVPFLHWMIALIAGMQHDEPGRLQATADLEAFGPDFVGRTLPIESHEHAQEWAKSWTEAQIGLMTEFEMLKGPDGKPLQSSLRTVNVEHGNP